MTLEQSFRETMSSLSKRRESGDQATINSVAYLQATDEQLVVLRKGLQRWPSCPTTLNDEHAAALVLVAGRILCSDNNAGSTYGTFEWTPVLRALGWSTSRPHELYPHLERGFSYWRLKLYLSLIHISEPTRPY